MPRQSARAPWRRSCASHIVGIVLPWSYPLFTLALKLAPALALASGNAVIAKPAEDSPLATLRLAQLAIEVGFPPGVFNVLPGRGGVVGRALGLHPDIDAINFTGSTEVGRQFLRYSAESNLKEVSLECGGKNPAIVLPDVNNLDRFMEAIGAGFLVNSGQVCSSISRLLLPAQLRYLGLVGSRRRRDDILFDVMNNGLTVHDALFAPAGLHLGAETPEEIAVSIAAEIIKVKNDR